MKIDAFPLQWPPGWKRTAIKKQSRFKTSFGKARDELFKELERMGVASWNVILSTNIPLRRDGIPYAGQANPNDPGVAIYFKHQGKDMVFACDTYRDVTDNIWAVRKTIEAIRGIERWGASDMMERAFTGFAALPPAKEQIAWWQILGFSTKPTHLYDVREQYKSLAKKYHPDNGTVKDADLMTQINVAYEIAKIELT